MCRLLGSSVHIGGCSQIRIWKTVDDIVQISHSHRRVSNSNEGQIDRFGWYIDFSPCKSLQYESPYGDKAFALGHTVGKCSSCGRSFPGSDCLWWSIQPFLRLDCIELLVPSIGSDDVLGFEDRH